jgi:hypothetical protein
MGVDDKARWGSESWTVAGLLGMGGEIKEIVSAANDTSLLQRVGLRLLRRSRVGQV